MLRILVPLLLVLLATPALSTELPELPEVVKNCLEQNLPESTSVQSIELRASDRSGYESVMQADVYWKRFADEVIQETGSNAASPELYQKLKDLLAEKRSKTASSLGK